MEEGARVSLLFRRSVDYGDLVLKDDARTMHRTADEYKRDDLQAGWEWKL